MEDARQIIAHVPEGEGDSDALQGNTTLQLFTLRLSYPYLLPPNSTLHPPAIMCGIFCSHWYVSPPLHTRAQDQRMLNHI